MKAIILAAGSEGILEDITPKCLMKLGNELLLETQVKTFQKCGITDISIVVGKEGGCWNEETYSKIRSICPKVIVNNENLTTKNAFSLSLGLRDIDEGPVVVADGDILFSASTLSNLLQSHHASAIITRKPYSVTEKSCIVNAKENRITDIGENLQPQTFPWYIYSGIIKIGEDTFQQFKHLAAMEKYKEAALFDVIREIAQDSPIYNIDSSIQEDHALRGGSHANTRKVMIVRKEAVYGREKLVDEINWLTQLPESLKGHFTTIKYSDINANPPYYEMPYYNFPSLRKLIMGGKIGNEKALSILRDICDFMFHEVYTKRKSQVYDQYAKIVHMNRIRDRLQETIEKSPILAKIIQSSSVQLNGKNIPNIFIMLARIENNPSLLRLLQPDCTHMVHGDLHFDNVLIELDLNNNLKNFVLVDPRGKDGTYDYSYDLGKLWHSFYGLYDFFHENLFNLDINFSNQRTEARYEIHDSPALAEFKSIHEKFEDILKDYDIIKNDPYWKLKTLFSNASHFCSMLPFHLKGDSEEKKAAGIYLRGMEMLNEFLEICQKMPELKKGFVGDGWININTLEDYQKAKELIS